MNRHEKARKVLKEGTMIPASPLALNQDRKFDEKRQRLLIKYYLESGVGGIAAAVHTTQFEIRKPQVGLFEPVLRVVSDEIDRYEKETGKVIVKIAGVCGETRQALAEAKTAKEYGYDALLLSPGGLSHLTEEEMIERTKAVAEVMPVIGFYLQPSVGGRVFSYEYWEKICEIQGVVAIKAAPFDRYLTADVVRAAALSSRADEITLYTGNDDNILIDLSATYEFVKNGKSYSKKFEGGLLGHWSVWTHAAVQLFQKIKEKRLPPEKLLTLAVQITDANSAFFDTANGFRGCIAGLHEVLRRQKLFEGIWCIDPEETLSEGQKEEIDRVYEMYPELNDDAFIQAHIEEWEKYEGI